MTRVRLLAALLPLLSACGHTDYAKSDYYSLLPDLVRFTDADARQNAKGAKPEGPVFIDIKSFAGGGWQLTGEVYNRDTVMAIIAENTPSAAVRVEKPQDALVIQDTGAVATSPEAVAGLAGGRFVKQYGVLLHLNLVKADNQEIAATVTSFATDRSSWPTGICRRVQRVTYRKDASGTWKRTRNEVRRRCEDPD